MAKSAFYTALPPMAFFFFCFTILGCKREAPPKSASLAFYHWKTQFRLTSIERNYLDSLNVKKLYVKFFDVDWDEAGAQPVPLANIEMDTALLSGLEIVPCIFITNRTLLKLPMQEVDSLAARIFQKIKALTVNPPKEIQLDCDWTEQTQAKYFSFLNSIKRFAAADSSFIIHHSSFTVSATIRLHQFKYPEKTGVPPVDRGMLMCYNMGDLENWETENSILDLAVADSYLSQASIIGSGKSLPAEAKYPLPLDFALPIFQWGVLFREGRMIKLLNNLDSTHLQDNSRFLKTAQNRYEVVKSTYLNAHYLYSGDQIRLETTTPPALVGLAQLLNSEVAMPSMFTLAFYHLDTTALDRFPKQKIEEVVQQF